MSNFQEIELAQKYSVSHCKWQIEGASCFRDISCGKIKEHGVEYATKATQRGEYKYGSKTFTLQIEITVSWHSALWALSKEG